MSRPSWDEYFIGLVSEIGKRATCDRGKSGCLITRDNQIISTGYVGSPPGLPHCDDVGHLFQSVLEYGAEGSADAFTTKQHCVRTIHAEQNAICQAAKHGLKLQGATLYCKMEPCRVCAMLIISVGIVKVVALKKYQSAQETREMFKTLNIELLVVENTLENYALICEGDYISVEETLVMDINQKT